MTFILRSIIGLATVLGSTHASADDSTSQWRIACQLRTAPESGQAPEVKRNSCIVAKPKKGVLPAEAVKVGTNSGDEFLIRIHTESVEAAVGLSASGLLSYSISSASGASSSGLIPASSLDTFAVSGFMVYLDSKDKIDDVAVGSYFLKCFQLPPQLKAPQGCSDQ